MTLKLATLEDIPAVVEMVKEFIASSRYSDLPSEPEKIEYVLTNLLRDRNKGIIVLYLVDGKPVGTIGGLLTEMLFSTEPVAAELFWWVSPKYRSRRSLKLKEAFEYWAKRVGARHIQMASLNDEKVSRYYERTGYRQFENAFLKAL